MHSLHFLVGTLAVLIGLLFLGLIVLLWGLRQLLIIGQQNDTMITLLEQLTTDLWRLAPAPPGLEDNRGAAPSVQERQVKVFHQGETLSLPEPRLPAAAIQGIARWLKAAG
jgi:hypothetical protein